MRTPVNQNPKATRLKRARLATGITQQEFADLLGVDRQSVSYYERRGITKIGVAKRYAGALTVAQLNGAGEGPQVDPLELLEI